MRFSHKIIAAVIVLILIALSAYFAYGKVIRMIYPIEYSELVEKYSEQRGLDPMFVYAVIKCESGFDKDAISVADAKGLMQLTDDTFAWVQTKDPDSESLTPDKLYDPETNIKYGTLLISLHITEFGNTELALAAYHAGRGIVNRWLEDEAYSGDGRTLDSVPYKETQAYITKVLKTKDIYEKLYGKGE